MPIAFAPVLGLSLGAAFAWLSAAELARDDGPVIASRPFAVVAAYVVLLWLPIVGYFVAFHGDWSYLYLVSWQRVPSAIDLGLVLLAGAAVLGGFWSSVSALRSRRVGPVVALIVAPSALSLAGLTLAAHRLSISGTYAQVHGEFGTEPIGASALGKGVLLMDALLALGVLWTTRTLTRMAADTKS